MVRDARDRVQAAEPSALGSSVGPDQSLWPPEVLIFKRPSGASVAHTCCEVGSESSRRTELLWEWRIKAGFLEEVILELGPPCCQIRVHQQDFGHGKS